MQFELIPSSYSMIFFYNSSNFNVIFKKKFVLFYNGMNYCCIQNRLCVCFSVSNTRILMVEEYNEDPTKSKYFNFLHVV